MTFCSQRHLISRFAQLLRRVIRTVIIQLNFATKWTREKAQLLISDVSESKVARFVQKNKIKKNLPKWPQTHQIAKKIYSNKNTKWP
jgi:hypothetical protein